MTKFHLLLEPERFNCTIKAILWSPGLKVKLFSGSNLTKLKGAKGIRLTQDVPSYIVPLSV